ncbi:MAG: FxsA family protein [bacterium]
MFYWLLILFIGIPLLELALLIKVGALIGTLNTILLILITGVVGAALAQQQGLGVITRIREELIQGRVPSDELLNGICVLIGGFLLLTPGLLTDAMGFALLIPPVRELIKKYLRYRFKRKWKRDIF